MKRILFTAILTISYGIPANAMQNNKIANASQDNASKELVAMQAGFRIGWLLQGAIKSRPDWTLDQAKHSTCWQFSNFVQGDDYDRCMNVVYNDTEKRPAHSVYLTSIDARTVAFLNFKKCINESIQEIHDTTK